MDSTRHPGHRFLTCGQWVDSRSDLFLQLLHLYSMLMFWIFKPTLQLPLVSVSCLGFYPDIWSHNFWALIKKYEIQCELSSLSFSTLWRWYKTLLTHQLKSNWFKVLGKMIVEQIKGCIGKFRVCVYKCNNTYEAISNTYRITLLDVGSSIIK